MSNTISTVADKNTSEAPVAKGRKGSPEMAHRNPATVSYTHLTLPTIYSV